VPDAIAAAALAPSLSADAAIALDPCSATLPADTVRRALGAVRLSRALVRAGWTPHQHRGSVKQHEPESTPHPTSDAATEAAIDRVQTLLDTLAERGMPRLTTPFLPWEHDDQHRVRLNFASRERPAERSVTRTDQLPIDKASIIWKHLVAELAAEQARADVPGRSSGRVFLGPKDRLIFWPKLLNALLVHTPTSVGRIFDMFTVCATAGVKLDVKSAYRAIGIAPEDAAYHAAIVDGVWITFTRLSFGMAQSPAIFGAAIGVTIERFRDSLPATAAALAQYVDDSGVSGSSPSNAVVAAEQLIRALLRDGWWVSVSKTFLLPCSRLYYTGFIADFATRAVRLAETKTGKVIKLLRSVKRPTDSALAAAAAAASGSTATTTSPTQPLPRAGAAPATAPPRNPSTTATAVPRHPTHACVAATAAALHPATTLPLTTATAVHTPAGDAAPISTDDGFTTIPVRFATVLTAAHSCFADSDAAVMATIELSMQNSSCPTCDGRLPNSCSTARAKAAVILCAQTHAHDQPIGPPATSQSSPAMRVVKND